MLFLLSMHTQMFSLLLCMFLASICGNQMIYYELLNCQIFICDQILIFDVLSSIPLLCCDIKYYVILQGALQVLSRLEILKGSFSHLFRVTVYELY